MNNTTQLPLIARINTERKLYTFIERVAKNRAVKDALPITHNFFTSLHNFRATRGMLTDNQKRAANASIAKYANQFEELMQYKTVQDAVQQPDEQIERAAIQQEDAPLSSLGF